MRARNVADLSLRRAGEYEKSRPKGGFLSRSAEERGYDLERRSRNMSGL